jgi:hypothetical protein
MNSTGWEYFQTPAGLNPEGLSLSLARVFLTRGILSPEVPIEDIATPLSQVLFSNCSYQTLMLSKTRTIDPSHFSGYPTA